MRCHSRRTAVNTRTRIGLAVLAARGRRPSERRRPTPTTATSTLALPLKANSVRFAVIGDAGTGDRRKSKPRTRSPPTTSGSPSPSRFCWATTSTARAGPRTSPRSSRSPTRRCSMPRSNSTLRWGITTIPTRSSTSRSTWAATAIAPSRRAMPGSSCWTAITWIPSKSPGWRRSSPRPARTGKSPISTIPCTPRRAAAQKSSCARSWSRFL